jgi:dethiobiotin synthetase
VSRTFIVTGTDTDIGKTVFAAGLTRALGATYWKPVQADHPVARCRAGRGHDRSGRARFA